LTLEKNVHFLKNLLLLMLFPQASSYSIPVVAFDLSHGFYQIVLLKKNACWKGDVIGGLSLCEHGKRIRKGLKKS
jgi:hypothetical protein